MSRMPNLLQVLYEAELYDEDFMVCWHEAPPESDLGIPRPAAVEMRKRAQPFIDWLKNAEEEDEDDEDEDD